MIDFVRARTCTACIAYAITLFTWTAIPGRSALGQDVTAAQQTVPEAEASALDRGLELEGMKSWSEAVSYYEKAVRDYPRSTTLYQRLIICRLRYDVNRRYLDESFLASVRRMGTSQTLDLYSEILANLQTHYVDEVDWARIQIHGTAALEVALTENRFIENAIPNSSPAAVERFYQTVHQRMSTRRTDTRFDLRANAEFVAGLAQSELGLSPTATVFEYLCGAVSTLDPYTRLLSPDQREEMFNNIEGNFVGLGIELKTGRDYLQILSVIPNGPAHRAGIIAGERIMGVDQTRTDAADPDLVADLLRGPEYSEVSLVVAGIDGTERTIHAQRRRVEVPSVENIHYADVENGVAYFRLTNFQKTTTRDVERALWELQRQGSGMQSLVIDVRGNPGGLLSAAVEVADRFIREGRIVSTRGRNARENFDYQANRNNTWNVPLAVLIDGDSASASEIFAGAIADSGRGIIIGQQSYGKGSVQGIFRMQAARFGLCLTTAKFYSPSGRPISGNGVTPSITVESKYIAARPDDAGRLTRDADDAVLQEAVKHFAGDRIVSRRS